MGLLWLNIHKKDRASCSVFWYVVAEALLSISVWGTFMQKRGFLSLVFMVVGIFSVLWNIVPENVLVVSAQSLQHGQRRAMTTQCATVDEPDEGTSPTLPGAGLDGGVPSIPRLPIMEGAPQLAPISTVQGLCPDGAYCSPWINSIKHSKEDINVRAGVTCIGALFNSARADLAIGTINLEISVSLNGQHLRLFDYRCTGQPSCSVSAYPIAKYQPGTWVVETTAEVWTKLGAPVMMFPPKIVKGRIFRENGTTEWMIITDASICSEDTPQACDVSSSTTDAVFTTATTCLDENFVDCNELELG